MEEPQELFICCETAEQGPVESIHGLTETTEKEASNETPCHEMRPAGFLLEESFMVCF